MHAGAYYVQDAASMLLGCVVEQLVNEPITALDLCAAPGGKTTLLAQYLPSGSIVIANETIRSRCNALSQNIAKWGSGNILITNSDPSTFAHAAPHAFNLMLVDAPCSGEAMFRKDHTATKQWSIDTVRHCMLRQRRIVGDAWHALMPGGILLYCTCAFNAEENERNAAWLAASLGADSLPLHFEQAWGVMPSEALPCSVKGLHAYRCMPHCMQGEGLFIAALRKHGAGMSASVAQPRRARTTRYTEQVRQWLRSEASYIAPTEHAISAFPARAAMLQHDDEHANSIINHHVTQPQPLPNDDASYIAPMEHATSAFPARAAMLQHDDEHAKSIINHHYAQPQPLPNDDALYIEQMADDIYAFSANAAAVYYMLKERLRFDLLPQRMATIKGGTAAPQAVLALSCMLMPHAFPIHALDIQQALDYLRGMPLACLPQQPHGYELLTYDGLPLGYGHVIGSRCNNLYPKAWRLHS
jgi:hypothetical protein